MKHNSSNIVRTETGKYKIKTIKGKIGNLYVVEKWDSAMGMWFKYDSKVYTSRKAARDNIKKEKYWF